MIQPELARRFIGQVMKYTDYNINIMDENGVIIASRDPGRVGTYHEAADRIIRGTEEVLVVRDEKMFPGVLPGINMAIMHEGRREGVVGVTGDPDQIRDIAMIIRLAIESMLRYEKQQEEKRLRRSRRDHLLDLLTQSEFADPAEIRSLAGGLGIEETYVRIPLLCRIIAPQEGRGMQALELLRAGGDCGPQDLAYVTDDTHVLMFKTLKTEGTWITDMREQIREYLEPVLRKMKESGIKAVFYAGTAQESFPRYYYAYRHCRWLETHVKAPEDIVFFMDRIREYSRTLTPRQELQRIFQLYDGMFTGSEKEQFIQMALALEEENYSLTKAAQKLYLHKNTLTYRYNRMKEQLGIDPLESAQDRRFLELLALYLAE